MKLIDERRPGVFGPVELLPMSFENKELSSFVYTMAVQVINLNQNELEAGFLHHVYDDSQLTRFMNMYLTVLEKRENEKFLALKGAEGFEISEVLESFSKDLKTNFGFYGNIFDSYKRNMKAEWEQNGPLKKAVNSFCMQSFFDGLNLTYKEKAFFVLNLANKVWGWLFPDFKDEEYKSRVFARICEIDTRSETALTRKLNNKFLRLGLFSAPWKINDFVFSFFTNEDPGCYLEKIEYEKFCDSYFFNQLLEENACDMKIIREQIYTAVEKNAGCFIAVSGTGDYRLRAFFSEYVKDLGGTLFNFSSDLYKPQKNELTFYLYAMAAGLAGQNKVIFIGSDYVKMMLEENQESEQKRAIKMLENIKCPVIISLENLTEKEKAGLQDLGINILFTTKFNLPVKDFYEEKAQEYFYRNKLTPKFFHIALEKTCELKIPAEKWSEVVEICNKSERLEEDELELLLERKYGWDESMEQNLRKNSNYSFEALNTTEPIEDLAEALKSAQQIQSVEQNSETGVRILLYGLSGTGKTAYVEQISRVLRKPLKIVRASEVIDCYVGETEKNISRSFKEAADQKAMLLIDEADSFLCERGDGLNRHNDRMVNEFLVQMERFPGILFCNTNLPDCLDEATDRRFNFKIGFNPLTKDGVTILTQKYFAGYNLDKSQIQEIFDSGEVTPGDFETLNGKLRFVKKEKLNAQFITQELCKIVRNKKTNRLNHKIGFGG